MRFYFYATRRPDGQWELRSSLTAQATAYPNRDAALLAARQNCRRHRELHGTACGVRIQAEDGSWVDEYLEGNGDPPPETGAIKPQPDRRRRS